MHVQSYLTQMKSKLYLEDCQNICAIYMLFVLGFLLDKLQMIHVKDVSNILSPHFHMEGEKIPTILYPELLVYHTMYTAQANTVQYVSAL